MTDAAATKPAPTTTPPPPARTLVLVDENEPIQHDGWKSRTFISCTAFSLVLLGLTLWMRLVEKLTEENSLWCALVAVLVFLAGVGLIKFDKILELIKMWLRAKLAGLGMPIAKQ